MDFPTNVVLGDSYTGICRATGNPRPTLTLVLSDDCPYSVTYTSPDTYTAQAVISISDVMMNCDMIYCSTNSYYNPLLEAISLNITFECDGTQGVTILNIPSVRNTTISPPELGIINPTITTHVNGSVTSSACSVSILILMATVALLLMVNR